MSSLQFTVTGLCVCLCNSVSQEYLFTKLFIHQKGAGCIIFMTHRPLAGAVLKKTTMSFPGCRFGKGLGLNHTVYCLKGRDGILNAIFFTFHFLPERKAGLQLTCFSSDFSGCSHYLFLRAKLSSERWKFSKISFYLERKSPVGRVKGNEQTACVGFLQKNGCGDCVCNRSARTALGAGVGPALRGKQACGWKLADTIRGFRALLSSAIETHELTFF